MPQKLDKDTTKKLVEFTAAQWSDGIGSGSFQDCDKEVLSTTLAMAILNTNPSKSDLGLYFVDAFPFNAGEPEVVWGESEHFDESLIADLKKKAATGNASAQLELAKKLLNGKGVPNDPHQAFALLEKSAEQNNPAAITQLAICYLQGKGTTADPVKAYNLFTKAAQSDFPMAFGCLGDLYQEGIGVKQDLEKGFSMYQRGSQLGDVICLHEVASCYETGKGVTKNLHKALSLYEQCEQRGLAPSKNCLKRVKSLIANGG